MIAIAGAKGGCGKTTATLGLAQAFARAGTPALAVDADRQLPNLHVTADVEREPTASALDEGTDVTALAQQTAGSPSVGVLPAPKPADTVDLGAALGSIEQDSTEVFVDCPSGAGPDIVEPLSAADGVVVVSTPTERSLTAAETTIDIARRLEVPVEGLLLNQCDSVPATVESDFDVPVLGAVPEREPPLPAEDARTAFDRAAAHLLDSATDPEPVATAPDAENRLATGVDALDRAFGGGFEPGTVVALTAAPASQSELLLYQSTTERGTLYLSTERSEDTVRYAIEESMATAGSPTVRHLDAGNPLVKAEQLISNLPEGANLIVDPADALERGDRDDYVSFLNALVEHTRATGSIAVLHCLDPAPANRSATAQFADVVVDLDADFGDEGLTHELRVSKSRRDGLPAEPVEIDLTTEATLGHGGKN